MALTEVYQQTIDSPHEAGAVPGQGAAGLAEEKARIEPLEAVAEAARGEYLSAVKAWYKAEESVVPLLGEQDKATNKHAEWEKKKEAATESPPDAQSQLAANRDTAKALAEAARRTSEVVKKLPNDKELIDATTISRRRAAAAAELSGLDKALRRKDSRAEESR